MDWRDAPGAVRFGAVGELGCVVAFGIVGGGGNAGVVGYVGAGIDGIDGMLTWGIVTFGCANGEEAPAGSAFGKDVNGGGVICAGTAVCCPAMGAYEDGLVRG